MQFRHETLDNGLEVIAECNENAHSIAVGFVVKAGARDEPPELAGVSHFLEHIAFKGTSNRTAEQINREFDDMGADSNAFTSEEQTAFYASLLPELQGPILDLLGDLLCPKIDPQEFELEKKVILEEISMYADQPPYGADDLARELFFDGHPLGNVILGSKESVASLNCESMREYLEKMYVTENIVLAASGKIDFEELLRSAERLSRNWKSSSSEKKTVRGLRHVKGKQGRHRIRKSTANMSYLMQLVDAPSSESSDTERFAAGTLANILGDESGSRLYWRLFDPGLVDSIWLGCYEHLDNGLFMTGLSCTPESLESNEALIREVYEETAKAGITEAELARAKTKICSRIVLSSERPSGRLFGLASDWIAKQEYRSIRTDIEAVKAINLDDLHKILKDYPLNDPLTVIIGPGSE